MSTRSYSSNLILPSSDPESIIQNRRRNLGDPSLLLDFEEINLANNPNNVQGLHLAGPNFPAPGLRLMEELLQAPTDGVGDVIVVPPVLASQFELKIGLLNLVTAISFHSFENDDPPSHFRRFMNITQTIKLNQVPHDIIKLIMFPFSFEGAARTWLAKEPQNSITTWNDLIDTFYNGLSQSDQDSLNSAAGGNLLTRNTQEVLTIIENKSKVRTSRNKPLVSSASGSTSQDAAIIALTKHVEALGKHINSMDKPIHSIQDISSETPLSPSSSPFKLPKRNPHQPLIPYPLRLNKEKLQDKSDIQVHKLLQMFKKLHFNISLAEALALMPKYAKMLKDLLSDKEKLLGLANTSLTKNCSAVLLKKLPEKLGDPGKFLIPCDFPELEKCMALADLGASINLMPLSVWKKLMLPELIPTRMTLELANWSVAYPAGIAEDVCVQVGKFTFPADFVVVDYDVDPRVPLILGRPFLRTARALVDVYGEELILRDGDEKLIFHADSTSKHPHKHGNESINMINFIDITCEDRFQEVLKIKKSNHPLSGSTTPPSDSFPSLTPFETSDSLLEEFTDEITLLNPFPPGNKDDNFDPEADLREIEYLLNRDPSTDSSPTTVIDIIDPILERFTDEPALIIIDELKAPESSVLLPQLLDCDSTLHEEFPEIDTLPSFPSGNEDKVFNPGILVYGNTHFVTNEVTQDKNLKEKTSSEALLILEERNFLSISSDQELLFP
ncbi:reverse transcriptase domain-containing protein [Tanacetum coccineum]